MRINFFKYTKVINKKKWKCEGDRVADGDLKCMGEEPEEVTSCVYICT